MADYTPGDYPKRLEEAWALAHLVTGLPLQKMVDQHERADAFGPIFHPSAYLERDRVAFDQDRSMLDALRAVQSVLAKIGAPTVSPTERAMIMLKLQQLVLTELENTDG